MIVNVSSSNPPSNVNGLGVALIDNDGQRHIGILYKKSVSEGVVFLHLAWHYRLVEEIINDGYVWIDSALDEDNKIVVIAFCKMISDMNSGGNIPYGFDFSGEYFSLETAKYIRKSNGEGLTCATFVLSVFQRLGFDLLKKDTWQVRPEDEVWAKKIIELLNKTPWVDPSHIEQQKELIGNVVRYRPEEVACGVGSSDIPLPFHETCERAADLLGQMKVAFS